MINYQNNGDGTSTITISYTNDSQKLLKALEFAAKNIWGGVDTKEVVDDLGKVIGTIQWSSLTSAQKIAILDDGLRGILLELAIKQYKLDAARAAAIAAEDGTVGV